MEFTQTNSKDIKYFVDKNGKIAGITEMYLKKNLTPSYTHRHRNILRESDDRNRRRRSRDLRNRRQWELEEELVRTGSEDENDNRKYRTYRRRKSDRKKEEKTYTKMSKERRDWKSQAARKEEMLRINDKQKKRLLGNDKHFQYHSHLSRVPNLKVTYLGLQPRANDGYGAVPVRVQKSKPEILSLPYKTSDTNKNDVHNLEKLVDSHKNKKSPRESNSYSNSESGAINIKVRARSKRESRESILNRAEKLLHNRKLREEYSSGEDGDTEKSDRDRGSLVQQRRVDYPSSDDEKYVMVKTTVSPSDSEIFTDLDVALPPLPQYESPSGKSIPSMTKVGFKLCYV